MTKQDKMEERLRGLLEEHVGSLITQEELEAFIERASTIRPPESLDAGILKGPVQVNLELKIKIERALQNCVADPKFNITEGDVSEYLNYVEFLKWSLEEEERKKVYLLRSY